MKAHPVKVLFGSSATHSFISTRLIEALGSSPTPKHFLICIVVLDGKVVSYEELFMGCPIQINSHEFLADLYKFQLTNLDIIMGMDWLSKY